MSKDVILTELCSGAWAIPPSMLMKSHDNDYYTCSKCGKPCEYKDTEVKNKKCILCDEPIGDLPCREVKTLKRFGQVLLEHVECPKFIKARLDELDRLPRTGWISNSIRYDVVLHTTIDNRKLELRQMLEGSRYGDSSPSS